MQLYRGKTTSAAVLIVLYVFGWIIQISEGRPHIRHRKAGGSHCSRCSPGWGMIEACTRGRDTRCAECHPGTYSPHHGTQPCWTCSRCGAGLYEAHPCTFKTDTVCDSCHRPAPDNPDYRTKCSTLPKNFFLAPEDAGNTAEESILVNDPRDFDSREEELLANDALAAMASAIGTATFTDRRVPI